MHGNALNDGIGERRLVDTEVEKSAGERTKQRVLIHGLRSGDAHEFLGVLYDNQVDDAGLLNFMSDYEMTYPVIWADTPVLKAYDYPRALPTTFVYDRKGKLVKKHAGPMSDEDLRDAIAKALKG